ncbi:L-fucose permease [Bifidobacterium sp. UTCIF-37]|uniref:MFS transporter n=2 Tax=Bifidobacterium callitrichos TaxID=762209 RepID=A0A2T3GBF3_9BIFI|nr:MULTISPECIES: MFS transporter [Bifidobacterium]KFI55933.1 major facilitator superfamily protein [Bifidobacterium callitrichos DSM 23973]PST46789.1 MFS transporter [Bifidobacterium callitrichos]TPF85493.1 L-fucose permease [Bifidobacterium sp. UTCIF-37]TPF87576.1 L-fucose permease [Bifidobacterium sp. UTCIF-38]
MSSPSSSTSASKTSGGKTWIIAFALVTLLFFIWGLAMNLVSAIRDPFAVYLNLNSTESSLLQVAYFGAYFVMAIPATMVAKRFGYKGGMICGLIFFVIGAFLTIPATTSLSYGLFLFAMFVIALGAASLEANCNPYITKLGDEKGESFRLNLAQSFNAVGSVVSPLILGMILGNTASVKRGDPGFDEAKIAFMGQTRMFYIVIGIILAVVLAVFVFAKLPSPPGDEEEAASGGSAQDSSIGALLRKPWVVLGVIAEFVYVGLQTIGFSTFSTFAQQQWEGMSAGTAATFLAILTLMFAIGRFVTTPFMTKFHPGKILGVYMIGATILVILTAMGLGKVSVITFIALYFFMSIAYGTIFALALSQLKGAAAKTGASLITMSIVGGAIIPLIYGAITDAGGMNVMLWCTVPLFLFLVWYAFWGCKIGLKEAA